MFDEVLQAIIDLAQSSVDIPIRVGSLPPTEGIAMTGNASNMDVYLDIGGDFRMNVVCNAKGGNQYQVIQWLDAIHRQLTRRKRFPTGAEWQIYAITTTSSPRLLGRESNDTNQWVYGSALAVRINQKGL